MGVFIKGCIPCDIIKAEYVKSRNDPRLRRYHRLLRVAHWRKKPLLQRKVDPKIIDAQIAELVEHEEAVRIKRDLEGQGYQFATSLYGVLHKVTTPIRVYRRIEVWSNRAIDAKRIVELHEGFTRAPPIFVYSIWTYDAATDQLKMAGGWERDE